MNHRLKKFFRRFLLTNRRKNFIFSSLLPKPPENPACETRHKNSRNAARPPLPAKAAKAQNRKRKVQQCPASPLPADERQSKKISLLFRKGYGKTHCRSTKHLFSTCPRGAVRSQNVCRSSDTAFAKNCRCLCEMFSCHLFRCKPKAVAFPLFFCPHTSCRKTH